MIIKSFAKPDMASQNDARGCVNISCYRTNRRNFLCHSANPHLASQCSWAWRANHGLLHYCLQHFKYDVTGIHWMNNLRLNFFASLHYTACFKPRKVHSHGKLGKIVVKNVNIDYLMIMQNIHWNPETKYTDSRNCRFLTKVTKNLKKLA